MPTRILNGGLELAILESIEQDRQLSESEKLTKEKLDSLPKNEWVYIDAKANPIPQVDVVSDFMKRVNKKESTAITVDDLKKCQTRKLLNIARNFHSE